MRVTLIVFGVMNLVGAVLVSGFGLGHYSATVLHFQRTERELIEAGALVEHPDAVGGAEYPDAWLLHELLPEYENQVAGLTHPISLALGLQRLILIVLAFVGRDRERTDGDAPSR